jgi:LysM repeat protein
MGKARTRYRSLDYPLFPQRRPWPRLILAGAVLGALSFAAWQRLAPTRLFPAQPASRPADTQVVLARSTSVIPTAGPAQAARPAEAATAEVIDDVEEVEAPWSEQAGRPEILTYQVQEGDSLWSIASQFGLDVDTLRWSNPDLERNPDMLGTGMELAILPVAGAYHTVQAGETLSGIAREYGVAELDILNYPLNGLQDPDHLREGQQLVIPHGRKEQFRPIPDAAADSPFAWPLVGSITQGFSEAHRAIDVGAPYAAPVYAGREGKVVRSGWARTGYGYTVIIEHGEGLQSLYSHMKGQWVATGEWVTRGQLIGEVGSTGNSSGPHVHFEVRVNGEQVNPLGYLPSGGPK